MTSIIKSDIFFFITTIAIVVVTIGAVVALVYLVQILRDMRDLSRRAKDEGERIIDGVSAYREEIHRRGFQINDLDLKECTQVVIKNVNGNQVGELKITF